MNSRSIICATVSEEMRREHILSVASTCLTCLLLLEEVSRISSSSHIEPRQNHSNWCQNQCKVCSNETNLGPKNSNIYDRGDICRCCSSNVVFREKGQSCGSQLSFRLINDESSPITILSTTWCKGDLVCTNSICRDTIVRLSKGSANLTLLLSGKYSSDGIPVRRNSEKLLQSRTKRSVEHRHSINAIGERRNKGIEQSKNRRVDNDGKREQIRNVKKTNLPPRRRTTSKPSNLQEDYEFYERAKPIVTTVTPKCRCQMFGQKSEDVPLQVKPRTFKHTHPISKFATNGHLGNVISVPTTVGEYQLIYTGGSVLSDLAVLLGGLSRNSTRANFHEIFETFKAGANKSEIYILSEIFSRYSRRKAAEERRQKSATKTLNFPPNMGMKKTRVPDGFNRHKRQIEEYPMINRNDTMELTKMEYVDDSGSTNNSDALRSADMKEDTDKMLSIDSLPTFNDSFKDRSFPTNAASKTLNKQTKSNDFLLIDETRRLQHTLESDSETVENPESTFTDLGTQSGGSYHAENYDSIYSPDKRSSGKSSFTPDLKSLRGDLPIIKDPSSAIAELLPVEDAKRILSNVDFKNPVNRWLTLWAYANVVQHENHFHALQDKLDRLLNMSSNNNVLLKTLSNSLSVKPAARRAYKIHPLMVEEEDGTLKARMFERNNESTSSKMEDTELIFPDQSAQERWDSRETPIPESKYRAKQMVEDLKSEADIQTKATVLPKLTEDSRMKGELYNRNRTFEYRELSRKYKNDEILRKSGTTALPGFPVSKVPHSNRSNHSRKMSDIRTNPIAYNDSYERPIGHNSGQSVTKAIWSLTPMWSKPLETIEKPTAHSLLTGRKDDLFLSDETKALETQIHNPSNTMQRNLSSKIEYVYKDERTSTAGSELPVTKSSEEKKERKSPSWKMFISGNELNSELNKEMPTPLIQPSVLVDSTRNVAAWNSHPFSGPPIYSSGGLLEESFGRIRSNAESHSRYARDFHKQSENKTQDSREYVLSIKDYDEIKVPLRDENSDVEDSDVEDSFSPFLFENSAFTTERSDDDDSLVFSDLSKRIKRDLERSPQKTAIEYNLDTATVNSTFNLSSVKLFESVNNEPEVEPIKDDEFAHLYEGDYVDDDEFDFHDKQYDEELDYIGLSNTEEYTDEYRAIGEPRK